MTESSNRHVVTQFRHTAVSRECFEGTEDNSKQVKRGNNGKRGIKKKQRRQL